MGIFDRLFGSGGKDKQVEEAVLPVFPWERKPSIYDHVVAHAKSSDLSENGPDLPDDERAFADSQIRWAAGAMDGVATHHMGGSDSDAATALLNVLVEYTKAPSVENKLKVYEKVIQTHTVSVIDPLIQALMQASQASSINFSRLYELAKSFATEATDREPVKLGVSLLGLFRQEQDKELFRILGRHDEFTLFCAVALGNAEGDSEHELWELGKSVNGWGRVHVVERLSTTDDPAIKDWLLRDGYKNSVMHEYLAYACATGGGLLSALKSDNVNAELLASAGDIIQALLRGGPAEDIDSYDDGAVAVELYVAHLMAKASSIPNLLGIAAVKDFLSNTEAKWDERASRGWTPELRTALSKQCAAIVEWPMWRPLVRADLDASDELVFDHARQAAMILGIDTWICHWKRVQDKPLEAGRWYHAMQSCGHEHVGELIDFALRTLPLGDIAKGPSLELGMDKEHQAHQCLGFVLQGLREYPGCGYSLIVAGLKSPVVSNRNGALRTLAAWGKANWPQGTETMLAQAMQNEPDEKLRELVQKVSDGKDLDSVRMSHE